MEKIQQEVEPIRTVEDSTKKAVLVVEDLPENQEVVQLMLESLGVSVEVVSNGALALAALERRTYSLVFMDCQMPEMDGYAATRAIRQHGDPAIRAVPVIAMTAGTTDLDRRKCLEAGMNDHVSKLLGREGLRNCLTQWLEKGPASSGQRFEQAEATIDSAVLMSMTSFDSGDSAALIQDLIRLFVEGGPLRIEGIRRAVKEGNISEAARTAHALRSSAAYLGAQRLGVLCEQFERNALLLDSRGLSLQVEEIEAEYRSATSELRKRFPSSSSDS